MPCAIGMRETLIEQSHVVRMLRATMHLLQQTASSDRCRLLYAARPLAGSIPRFWSDNPQTMG